MKQGYIKNVEKLNSSIVDWSFIATAARGTPYLAGDLDGILERRGSFLFLEAKSHPGIHLQTGQRLMLEALVRDGANKTVVIFYGSSEKIEKLELWHTTNRHTFQLADHMKTDTLVKVLKKIVEVWYQAADAHVPVDYSYIVRKWREFEYKQLVKYQTKEQTI